MLKHVLVILLLSSISTFAKGNVVATVNGKDITLKEFNIKYNEVKKQTINPPTPNVFLEDLIRFEVGVQEAKENKLEQDPIVKNRLKEELYKAQIEKAIGKEVEKITVNEKEMRKYYRKHPAVRTSHILIEFKMDATEKQINVAKKRAFEIYQEVRKSKRPFNELVKLYSDDTTSKRTGGDIGFQSNLTLVPTYYETARRLKVGRISKPIRTRFGFHIIKLTEVQKYKDTNKRQVRAGVFEDKRKQVFDKYFKKLLKKYKITRNKSLISKVK